MITIFVLAWFFVTGTENYFIPPHVFYKLEDCQKEGDSLDKYSQDLMSQMKITNYGGGCSELSVDTHKNSV